MYPFEQFEEQFQQGFRARQLQAQLAPQSIEQLLGMRNINRPITKSKAVIPLGKLIKLNPKLLC